MVQQYDPFTNKEWRKLPTVVQHALFALGLRYVTPMRLRLRNQCLGLIAHDRILNGRRDPC